jgi:hypothetical protein
MVRKRASLKDKGEDILGVKRGGKGADILFGTESQADPGASGTLSAEEGMPQGEADLDARLGAEAETAKADVPAYSVTGDAMPQGEADLDEELDLHNLLSAEAEAAGTEAGLPVLATTPAAPTPPAAQPTPTPAEPTPAAQPTLAEPSTLPPAMERPLPPPAAQPPLTAATSPASAAVPPPAVVKPSPALSPSKPATLSSPSPVPVPAVAPPSTVTGAPDLSVPRPPRYIQMVPGDFDLLAEEPSSDEAAAALTHPPEAVELTDEQRAELLRRRSVQQELEELDRAIDAQYERILRSNVSVNKWITDWSHNTLAEARNIVFHRQVDNLARAEWDVQQVRARLDRAEESRKKALRYAWPITIWGVLWFGIFVYLIFDPSFLLRYVGMVESTDTFLVPEIFLRTLFFGGIGAVAAVFYHLFKYVQERSFDSQFALSYVAKPFMGMILGSMIYLTVFVVTRALRIAPAGLADGSVETVTDVMYLALLYFIAMSAGFKENVAFDLLNRVIKSVLGGAPDEQEPSAPPPATTETTP